MSGASYGITAGETAGARREIPGIDLREPACSQGASFLIRVSTLFRLAPGSFSFRDERSEDPFDSTKTSAVVLDKNS